MQLYEAIRKWISDSHVQNPAIVFHTSCVNYDLHDLQETARLGLWILPDDVRVELMLLQDSVLYGKQARYLLEKSRSADIPWDLEELYEGSRQRDLALRTPVIFAFGSLLKLNEFLAHAKPLPGGSITYSKSWGMYRDVEILPLDRWQEQLKHKARAFWQERARPVIASAERLPLERLRGIYSMQYCGEKWKMHLSGIAGPDFKSTEKFGSYATIYTYKKLQNQYIKIYDNKVLSGDAFYKLEFLTAYAQKRLSHLPLAVPIELVELDDEKLVGYSMKKLEGQTLCYVVRHEKWQNNQWKRVMRNLARLLVELHCAGIMVNDLSYNNILVDKNDRVCLVDCDSFQLCEYPGGPMTLVYQHPEISAAQYYTTLRQPRHECFAFAVLLYQCLSYQEPLARKGGYPDEHIPNWKDDRFLMDCGGYCDTKAADAGRRWWLKRSQEIQQMFADEFHFRRDYSIGALARKVGLM